MVIRLSITFGLILLISCSKENKPKTAFNENALYVEQEAVNFFFNELINRDSLFYVQGDDGKFFELTPQTFLEDSLFIDGLFFWKKIYASNIVTGLSQPYYDSLLLHVIAPNMLNEEQAKEAEEFIVNFKSKKNVKIPQVHLKFPSTISVINDDDFKKRYLDNSLYLEVKHHIKSTDRYLVEISVYNLEYDEYKRIIIFIDKEYNVLDWKIP